MVHIAACERPLRAACFDDLSLLGAQAAPGSASVAGRWRGSGRCAALLGEDQGCCDQGSSE